MSSTCWATFMVRADPLPPYALLLTGSAPELGSWSLSEAIKMKCTPEIQTWSATVPLHSGGSIQYKYVLINPSLPPADDNNNNNEGQDGCNYFNKWEFGPAITRYLEITGSSLVADDGHFIEDPKEGERLLCEDEERALHGNNDTTPAAARWRTVKGRRFHRVGALASTPPSVVSSSSSAAAPQYINSNDNSINSNSEHFGAKSSPTSAGFKEEILPEFSRGGDVIPEPKQVTLGCIDSLRMMFAACYEPKHPNGRGNNALRSQAYNDMMKEAQKASAVQSLHSRTSLMDDMY